MEQDVISRLVSEKFDLVERAHRLKDYVLKYGRVLNDQYITLMEKQHGIMIDYIHVLDDRIAMLKGGTTK